MVPQIDLTTLNGETRPLANLPMYDWPETRASMDRFWELIANGLKSRGIDAPDQLNRETDLQTLWHSPRMILGQTCGWPYVSGVEDHARLVGLLDYGLPDCRPGYYRSVFIAHADSTFSTLAEIDFLSASTKIAINGDDSQSGYRVLLPHLPETPSAPQRSFVVTGAHRASVQAVAEGRADIAAIDAMAFRLAERHEHQAWSKVKVISQSPQTPGTPLVTSKTNEKLLPVIRLVVADAIDGLSPDDRNALSLHGVVGVAHHDYDGLRAT